jgi:hypothetical protein
MGLLLPDYDVLSVRSGYDVLSVRPDYDLLSAAARDDVLSAGCDVLPGTQAGT